MPTFGISKFEIQIPHACLSSLLSQLQITKHLQYGKARENMTNYRNRKYHVKRAKRSFGN